MQAIHLDQEQYRALLDLVYLGDWVIYSHDVGPMPKESPYAKLQEMLYRQASDFDLESLVIIDEDGAHPSALLEDNAQQFVDSYDEDTFYEQLVSQLSRRMMVRDHSEEEYTAMSIEERVKKFDEYEESLSEELLENALDQLAEALHPSNLKATADS